MSIIHDDLIERSVKFSGRTATIPATPTCSRMCTGGYERSPPGMTMAP
jgi:hypothetical protein